MQSRQNVDWQMARSHIYGLLGSILSQQPSAQTIEQLMHPEAVEHLAALFPDPGIGRLFRRLAEQYATGEVTADQVALDYESLMRVPGPAYTHPYESSYSANGRAKGKSKSGGLGGRPAHQAERFYQSEGLTPRYGRVDFADHIGAELTFMAHLCRRMAKALTDGDTQTASRIEAKQRQFGCEHLFRWAEDFCTALNDGAATPFFKGLAQILRAFIAMEKEIVSAD